MANSVKESANREHNLGQLVANAQDAHRRVYQLHKQIDAIKEAQIAPLQQQISKIKKNACTDAKCNMKDFNLAQAIYRRQEEARQFEDEAERDKVLDGLRFQFDALGRGEMLDFVSFLSGTSSEAADAAPAPKPSRIDAASYDAWVAYGDEFETGDAVLLVQQHNAWVTYSAGAEAVFNALNWDRDMISVDHPDLGKISALSIPAEILSDTTDTLNEKGLDVVMVDADGNAFDHSAAGVPADEAAAE